MSPEPLSPWVTLTQIGTRPWTHHWPWDGVFMTCYLCVGHGYWKVKHNIYHVLFFDKSLLNLLKYCFCFMFWFFGREACGILVLQPGFEPSPPSLEEVLTPGPRGKSLACILKANLLFSKRAFERMSFRFTSSVVYTTWKIHVIANIQTWQTSLPNADATPAKMSVNPHTFLLSLAILDLLSFLLFLFPFCSLLLLSFPVLSLILQSWLPFKKTVLFFLERGVGCGEEVCRLCQGLRETIGHSLVKIPSHSCKLAEPRPLGLIPKPRF